MTQLIAFQVRLTRPIADQVKAHCAKTGQRYGECLRALIVDACNAGLSENRSERVQGGDKTSHWSAGVVLSGAA